MSGFKAFVTLLTHTRIRREGRFLKVRGVRVSWPRPVHFGSRLLGVEPGCEWGAWTRPAQSEGALVVAPSCRAGEVPRGQLACREALWQLVRLALRPACSPCLPAPLYHTFEGV